MAGDGSPYKHKGSSSSPTRKLSIVHEKTILLLVAIILFSRDGPLMVILNLTEVAGILNPDIGDFQIFSL